MTVGPKLFVSYSWTTPDHEAWVLRLATDLRQAGIDVILDKWDLKEGHDAHAFMEKMVTDPEIKKVILICDKAYVDKTDGRSGGVGTEAQIISGKIYDKQAQDKFVAVVKDRDGDGKPFLPAYYRSRIYIDFSDSITFSEAFETLLRWAYDQPLYQKPQIGQKPTFLVSETTGAVCLATSLRLRRAVDALRNNRDYAIPATAEYFNLLSDELEKLRIDSQANPFDDAVVQSIESFLPYRDEAIGVFVNLAAHVDTLESRTMMHRFFEQIIPYMDCPQNITTYREWDWDNFGFIIYELFLYAVSALIRHERFESAAYLMGNQYYVPSRARFGRDVMFSFDVFQRHLKSLASRNERLQLRRLSLRADLLKQRCIGLGFEFHHLMQTDFVLFMRSQSDEPNHCGCWLPDTLIYNHSGPFEVFARSRSASYFNRAKVLLGIENKEALKAMLDKFAARPERIPRWGFESFNPAYLVGYSELATTP
jgi:hypothetical protein